MNKRMVSIIHEINTNEKNCTIQYLSKAISYFRKNDTK